MPVQRVFDSVVSVVALCLLAPIFTILAILIFTFDGRPIFFSQARVGMKNRSFQMLKFRTMRNHFDESSAKVTTRNDPRITLFGSVLRRTKLDELPQILNVLWGDMALVGPRPEVERYVELWDARDRDVILSVRPGLTDPVTLTFLDEEKRLEQSAIPEQEYVQIILPQKVAGYRSYVETKSFLGDAKIIVQTLMVLAKRIAGIESA